MSNRIPRKVSLTHWTSFKSSSHVANTKSLFSFFHSSLLASRGKAQCIYNWRISSFRQYTSADHPCLLTYFQTSFKYSFKCFLLSRLCKLWCLTFYSQRSQSIYVPFYFYLCYLYKCQMSDWTLFPKLTFLRLRSANQIKRYGWVEYINASENWANRHYKRRYQKILSWKPLTKDTFSGPDSHMSLGWLKCQWVV